MQIGITYDLRSDYAAMGLSEEDLAEFDREETIIAIENSLQSLGHNTNRIGNAYSLLERLVKGHKWDLVFNIAEGLYGIGREAQVPAILDLYKIPYTFSDPLVLALTLHKGMTKRVIRDAKVPTAPFIVADTPDDIEKIDFQAPYFVKPVGEGTGKGISSDSLVNSKKDLQTVCQKLIKLYNQPVIIEKYLPGREFTVGILGTGKNAKILGTIEVILLANADQGMYSYMNKEHYEERVQYRFIRPNDDKSVAKAEEIALTAWKVLGCRDAGRMDLRCDENGIPNFMEVNPLAGLRPIHSDLCIICDKINIPYKTLIERIVSSASLRLKL